jgi:hypothetical protein
MVSWFGPRNQAGYDLSVAPQNRSKDEDSVGHTSRSSSLLRQKASRARVFQSSLKTGGGVAWMVHMASSRRLHQVEAKDGQVDSMGCIVPFYPNFVIFYVLGHRGILFFSILLGPINRTLEGWGSLSLLQFQFAFLG